MTYLRGVYYSCDAYGSRRGCEPDASSSDQNAPRTLVCWDILTARGQFRSAATLWLIREGDNWMDSSR